jgi:threonine synthase
MKYVSTRGTAPVLGFEEVLLAGLARDGGLYVPERWPSVSAQEIRALAGAPYPEVALAVLRPFVGDGALAADLKALVEETYAGFDHAAVTPLKQLDQRTWLLELFHGPTLAFKDIALQLVGRLFDRVLAERGQRVTIVGATSGDTGSAAIEACRDRERIEIYILHPQDRVSPFDDCQDLLKGMFNDQEFRDQMGLSAVNSINWARIMAQIVYYFAAAVALGGPERAVAFAVPTGNFGNVFAGYGAKRMGLPVSQLIVGSNRNDILTRFFETGTMSGAEVQPTLSPSMDIQISSNFERLLFELSGRDGAAVARTMTAFRQSATFSVSDDCWRQARELFDGHRLDDDETLREIARLHRETGELVDPHTAIGIAAGRAKARDRATPLVALATAHPAKFPDAVEQATGERPALPPQLSDLFEREERLVRLPNDLAAVESYIRGDNRRSTAALPLAAQGGAAS